MTRTSKEAREAFADRDWWKAAGDIIGLRLHGWTFRNTASFFGDRNDVIQLPGYVADRLQDIASTSYRQGLEDAAKDLAPAFITSNSGGGKYFVHIGCGTMAELHAWHSAVLELAKHSPSALQYAKDAAK